MKIHTHYSWHQTGLGAQRGLICSWMWDAAETVACLACVCVAEVVEGWRRKGYQWATAGVPQSQPSTCCYHNWQAGPQPQGLMVSLSDWSWGCGLGPRADLITFMSACSSVRAQVVSLSPLLLSFMSACLLIFLAQFVRRTEKFQCIVLCRIMQRGILCNASFNKTSLILLMLTGIERAVHLPAASCVPPFSSASVMFASPCFSKLQSSSSWKNAGHFEYSVSFIPITHLPQSLCTFTHAPQIPQNALQIPENMRCNLWCNDNMLIQCKSVCAWVLFASPCFSKLQSSSSWKNTGQWTLWIFCVIPITHLPPSPCTFTRALQFPPEYEAVN